MKEAIYKSYKNNIGTIQERYQPFCNFFEILF